MPRIAYTELLETFQRILVGRGCPVERAALSARLMAETSADGVYSHGVNRFPRVVEYIDKGYIDLAAEPVTFLTVNAAVAATIAKPMIMSFFMAVSFSSTFNQTS